MAQFMGFSLIQKDLENRQELIEILCPLSMSEV